MGVLCLIACFTMVLFGYSLLCSLPQFPVAFPLNFMMRDVIFVSEVGSTNLVSGVLILLSLNTG